MKKRVWIAGAALVSGIATAGPVYKCTVNGKTSYSDEPCMNAKEVDVTPTEGINSMTGSQAKSAEQLSRDMTKIRREALSKALAPIASVTPEDFEREAKRANLPAADKQECKTLDSRLKTLKAEQPTNEKALYEARARFFKLKC